MRKELNLFGVGFHGRSPNVTANRLVNAYYEFKKENDRTKVAIYGTPGLTLLTDRGDTPWRGLLWFPGTERIYGVHRGTFYEVDPSGTTTARGTIGTTSGRVDISDNGTEVAVVDGAEIYVYNTTTPATPIAAVADAERPTSPNTCTFQGARILTDENGTGQFKGSDNYAATSWTSTSVATAESNSDNVFRVVTYQGTVVLFGQKTTEFWANTGTAGFPYARIISADLETGLAARWSCARFIGTWAFLGKNREGQVIVCALDGYNIRRLSNSDLEFVINNYNSVGDATGIGYVSGGHAFYQLNFPNEGKSWLYDATTDYWSELKSGTGRHRAELGVDFINDTIVADYENGKLYKVDPTVYTDNGTAITMELTGSHVYESGLMLRLPLVEIHGETGTGLANGQGSNPQIAMQLSRDGGHSFGTIRFTPWGKAGEYTKRARWRKNGSGRDIVPRLYISDPVKRVITTATLVIEGGTS